MEGHFWHNKQESTGMSISPLRYCTLDGIFPYTHSYKRKDACAASTCLHDNLSRARTRSIDDAIEQACIPAFLYYLVNASHITVFFYMAIKIAMRLESLQAMFTKYSDLLSRRELPTFKTNSPGNVRKSSTTEYCCGNYISSTWSILQYWTKYFLLLGTFVLQWFSLGKFNF